jgi:hypothetical protein
MSLHQVRVLRPELVDASLGLARLVERFDAILARYGGAEAQAVANTSEAQDDAALLALLGLVCLCDRIARAVAALAADGVAEPPRAHVPDHRGSLLR